MIKTLMDTRKRTLLLIFLASLFFLSGCDTLQEYFPLPTERTFPTLTPGPTRTGTPTPTPTTTNTPTPTQVTPAQAGTALNGHSSGIEPENVTEIDLIIEAGKGIPQQIAAAPDGSFLVVATSNGVYLHDPVTLAELLGIQTSEVQQSVAVAANGLIASGDRLGKITIWNSAGEQQLQLSGIVQPVLALAFSQDSSLLAASTWDGSIRVWNVADGALVHTLNARQRPVRLLAFPEDDSLLYAWAQNESIQIWDLEEGEAREEYYIPRDAFGFLPQSGAFDQNTTMFAANYGRTIRVYRLQRAATLRQISDLQNLAKAVAISPNGIFLAGLQEGVVSIWNIETGALTARLAVEETQEILLLAFSTDSSALFTLGSSLQRWAIPESSAEEDISPEVESQNEYRTSISAYSAAAPEEILLFAGIAGSVESYHLVEGTLRQVLPALSGDFTSYALFSNETAALGASDGQIILRSLEEEQTVTLPAHSGPVRSLAFSANGSLLASGGEDNQVIIRELEEQRILHSLTQESPPQSILFTPDEKFIFVLNRSGVHMWDLATEEVIQQFPGYQMALSGDGVILAVVDRNSGIPVANLYRLPSGENFESIPLDGSEIALSPDHSLLAMAGRDITLWSVIEGSLLQRVENVGVFGNLHFSPDGKWLILTAWDGSIRVWGVPE